MNTQELFTIINQDTGEKASIHASDLMRHLINPPMIGQTVINLRGETFRQIESERAKFEFPSRTYVGSHVSGSLDDNNNDN